MKDISAIPIDLTRDQVASHLQKYRSDIRKLHGFDDEGFSIDAVDFWSFVGPPSSSSSSQSQGPEFQPSSTSSFGSFTPAPEPTSVEIELDDYDYIPVTCPSSSSPLPEIRDANVIMSGPWIMGCERWQLTTHSHYNLTGDFYHSTSHHQYPCDL
jgi:hypothetical protein